MPFLAQKRTFQASETLANVGYLGMLVYAWVERGVDPFGRIDANLLENGGRAT
jgi:hypothetical protein